MLLSAVSVLVVAHSSSEIPEGLMNNSVYGGLQEDCAQRDVEFCYRLRICCRTQEYNSSLFAGGRSVAGPSVRIATSRQQSGLQIPGPANSPCA